ncbi:metal-dependent phosphoesterase [Candidatus Bathyarchaeota archaeon]|nr:MAG: metal-dependent phosphoesterase [Candidatus Bathyarchaeota archaeon]
MIRIDLHVHTVYSGDSNINPKMLIEQLNVNPYVNAVAITDHDTIEGYRQVTKFIKAYEGLLVLPGIEVSTFEGHINVLGVEEMPRYPINAEELVDFARERQALIIIPHPYRVCGLGDHARKLNADAIETLNYRATKIENRLAEQLARELNLPGVAGTDAHRPNQLFRVYTEVNADPDVDSILKAIKNGDVRIGSLEGYEFKY